jgi:organic radical activating enzyme
MKKINNIFYSLQGEGRNTGRAAVFIRFAGCNLHCPFCDTEFVSYREMSDDEILAEISKYEVRKRREERGERREDSSRYEVRGKATGRRTQFGNARYEDSSADEPDFVLRKPLIVLTGGEPTLQVDEAFVDLLHQHGYEVAMESNGTLPLPRTWTG